MMTKLIQMTWSYSLPLALVLLSVFPGVASAQQTQGDPALPDLAPREVEIRGRLEIAFPSLQRQPLIGFNPPPRIPELPPQRRPFIAPYKQQSAELPPSPLRLPPPPSAASLLLPPAVRGVFEAGAGRYLTRFVNARFGVPVSPTGTLTGKLDYKGTDGFTPFEIEPDLRTPFDALEASLSLQTRTASLLAGIDVDGFFDRFTLYGTETPVRSIFVEHPEREARGLGIGVWAETPASNPVQARTRIRYGATRVHTDVLAEGVDGEGPFSRLERRLDLEADAEVPLTAGDVNVEGAFSTEGLDADGFLGSTVQAYDAAAAYHFVYQGAYHVRLGLRLIGFRARGQTRTGGNRTAGYITPDVRVDLYPAPGVNFYLQNRPSLTRHSLSTLYRENPYLVDEPRLQPTLTTIAAEAGVQYFTGGLHLTGRAGFTHAPNFLYFRDAGGSGALLYTRGVSSAEYGRARIFRVGGEAALSLPGGLHASLGLTFREGRLTREEADIPYFAPLTGEVMVSYAFAGRRGMVKLLGTYESPRYRTFEQTDETRVDTYFDLDAELRYRFSPWIGASVRLENLLGDTLERWDRYPQVPRMFGAGLMVRF